MAKGNAFPKKAYGRSPVGNNPAPSGKIGNDTSTNQIAENEEHPVEWSEYYQAYVSPMAAERAPDKIVDQERHEIEADEQSFRDRAGFKRTL